MNTAQQANKTPFKSVDTMRFPVFVLVAVSAILIGRGAAAPLMTSDKVIAALEEAMMSGSGEWKAPIVSPTAPAEPIRASYRPVVLMHGLGDAGSNPGMQSLAQSVMAKYPGSYAVAFDVADGIDSFLQPMEGQVEAFAAAVRADPKLANGFNAVGLSQGGLVVRAYIQKYNNPPVFNFVSICGVQNGEFDCPAVVQIIPFLCDLYKSNPYHFLDFLGLSLSFAGYWKNPMNQTEYLTENTFLTDLNNDLQNKNGSYRANMVSLNKLVLVEATEDTVVYPYQSEQFGGYEWGTTDKLFNLTTSPEYEGDWFGLKTLNMKGKIDYLSYAGAHVQFTQEFWDNTILPYFNN